MPGYLKPHFQIIIPGPESPKHVANPNLDGREGRYWVEFTFLPNAFLKTELETQELRNGFIGDSHLVISDPLPKNVDRKHIFTVQAPQAIGEYFFYCNTHGRLSHANFLCQAKNFNYAINIGKENFEPFLSGWSARFNTPLYIFRIRVIEESSDIIHSILYHQLYPEVLITPEDLNREYWFPEDIRIFDFYREALNTTSPKYQFVCYYKVIELVMGLRAKRDSQTRKNGGKPQRIKDQLMEEEWFMQHLSDDLKPRVLGKKFTIIKDDILRPIRNKIAHALLEDDDNYRLSDEEIFPYLPIAKRMAEKLLVAESQEQQIGITDN